jgi:hypothetical protein
MNNSTSNELHAVTCKTTTNRPFIIFILALLTLSVMINVFQNRVRISLSEEREGLYLAADVLTQQFESVLDQHNALLLKMAEVKAERAATRDQLAQCSEKLQKALEVEPSFVDSIKKSAGDIVDAPVVKRARDATSNFIDGTLNYFKGD